MSGKWWLAALTAMAGLGLATAACGGGGDSKTSATPGGSTTTAAGNAQPTPFATAIVNGNQFTSLKGYSVTFPLGWKPRSNFINTVDATVDAFFEPLPAGAPPAQAQANISVTCVVLRAASPEQFLADSKTRTARLPQDKDIIVSESRVSGVVAAQIAYRFESAQDPNAPKLDKHDLIFSNNKCDWTITLTAPEGQYDKYKPAFDGFLSAFKLT